MKTLIAVLSLVLMSQEARAEESKSKAATGSTPSRTKIEVVLPADNRLVPLFMDWNKQSDRPDVDYPVNKHFDPAECIVFSLSQRVRRDWNGVRSVLISIDNHCPSDFYEVTVYLGYVGENLLRLLGDDSQNKFTIYYLKQQESLQKWQTVPEWAEDIQIMSLDAYVKKPIVITGPPLPDIKAPILAKN